jgi:hypothetical protein
LLQSSEIDFLLDDWLGQLTERQREIIERRYGLHGADVVTLDAIAADLGLTRERVRQIQMEGLEQLRKIIKRGNISRDSCSEFCGQRAIRCRFFSAFGWHAAANFFGQLKYRHGIEAGAVVAGDYVEILEPQPVFRLLSRRDKINQCHGRFRCGHRADAAFEQVATFRWAGCRLRSTKHPAVRQSRRNRNGLSGLPAVLFEKTGDATDRIIGAVGQIDTVVTVEIDA